MTGCSHHLAAVALAVSFACGLAGAQTYPAKPVRMLVPFPPGGGTDFTARVIAQHLSEMWGQQIVIENRPGASTTIASEMVARAVPDGYMLIMGSTNHTINPSLYAKLPYDTINDFTPITVAITASYVLVVHPSLPVKTTKDLIALARARKGEINYASSGSAGPQHIAGELFKLMAGIDMTHVPYRGGGPASVALLGGHVQAQFSSPVSAIPHVKSGRLRVLGVSSLTRFEALPAVPTIAESALPGYHAETWWGLLGPARLPREIVQKIHGDVVKALQIPETREKLAREGVNPAVTSPEQFAAMIKTDIPRMAKIVKAASMKVD